MPSVRQGTDPFHSPRPTELGQLDLCNGEMREAIDCLLEFAGSMPQVDSPSDLIRASYIPHQKAFSIRGSDSLEIRASTRVIFDHYFPLLDQSDRDTGSHLLLLNWTFYHEIIDEFHTDSPFIFSALTGLPIEFYVGPARRLQQYGEKKRMEIDSQVLLESSIYGQVLRFSRLSVHRRGLLNALSPSPVLRLNLISSGFED